MTCLGGEPSSDPAFVCETRLRGSPDATVHWTPVDGEAGVRLAVTAPTSTWLALGWSERGAMFPGQAVVVSLIEGASPTSFAVELNGRSEQTVVADGALDFADAALAVDGDRMRFSFRLLDAASIGRGLAVDPGSRTLLIAASGDPLPDGASATVGGTIARAEPTEPGDALGYHLNRWKGPAEGVALGPVGSDVSAPVLAPPDAASAVSSWGLSAALTAHAAVGALGALVMWPIAAALAARGSGKRGRFRRPPLLTGPSRWFALHRALALAGTVCIALAVALVVGGLGDASGWPARYRSGARAIHRGFGWALVALAGLQILGGALRPPAAGARSERSGRRRIFDLVHGGLGLGAVLLGIVQCFLGAAAAGERRPVGPGRRPGPHGIARRSPTLTRSPIDHARSQRTTRSTRLRGAPPSARGSSSASPPPSRRPACLGWLRHRAAAGPIRRRSATSRARRTIASPSPPCDPAARDGDEAPRGPPAPAAWSLHPPLRP